MTVASNYKSRRLYSKFTGKKKQLTCRIFQLAFYFFIAAYSNAQQSNIESFQKELNITQNDTIKLVLYRNIARIYAEINPDSAFHYAEKALPLSRKLGFKLDEASALREMG